MSDEVVCISHHMIWHDRQGGVERNSDIMAASINEISKLTQKRGEDATLFPSLKQTFWYRRKNNVNVKFVFLS